MGTKACARSKYNWSLACSAQQHGKRNHNTYSSACNKSETGTSPTLGAPAGALNSLKSTFNWGSSFQPCTVGCAATSPFVDVSADTGSCVRPKRIFSRFAIDISLCQYFSEWRILLTNPHLQDFQMAFLGTPAGRLPVKDTCYARVRTINALGMLPIATHLSATAFRACRARAIARLRLITGRRRAGHSWCVGGC